MSNEAMGWGTLAAWVRNPGTWGGAAVACGATHAIEIQSDSLTSESQLIENMGVSGKATQLPGVKGNETHNGELPFDMFYQGVEDIIGSVWGQIAAPAQQGSDLAYLHAFQLLDDITSKYGTLVFKHAPAIREYPQVRVNSFEIEFTDGQMGKVKLGLLPSGLNLNIGSPITNHVVASVVPANGARTIANQPTNPSPLTVLITDVDTSITEYILTIIGTDRDGNQITEVYTKSLNGLSWTTTNYFASVISIVASGLAGSAAGDSLVVGVSNGVNNATTVAGITLPTQRDMVLFSQLKVYCNDHSGAALAAADELAVSRFMLRVDRGQTSVVTTKRGNKPDEPRGGFIKVSGGINFPEWNSENHQFLKDYLRKTKKKLKAEAIGPIVNGSTAAQLRFLLNNVQFTSGSVNTPGPDRVPFDLEFMASRALTAPSGWSYLGPASMELVNARSSQITI